VAKELIQQADSWSNTVEQSHTLSASVQVDDVVFVVHMNNYYTLARLETPGGTGVTTWEQVTACTLDMGTNDLHGKAWKGVVTTAGGTVTENAGGTDEERYFGIWVFRGADLDTGGSNAGETASTSHVASSLTPTAGKTDDHYVGVFASEGGQVNYTPPGSPWNPRTEHDTGFNTYRGGEELLTSDAASGTRTSTSSASTKFGAVAILVKATASSGTAIGRATEADTARAFTAAKDRDLARATESDTARAITASKTRTTGRITETDIARTLAGSKAKTLGRATETDAAGSLTAAKSAEIGRATEADTARAFTASKTKTLGRVTESGTARALTPAKSAELGRVTEADVARTLTVAGNTTLGRATESDTARAFSSAKAKTLGRVTESSTARGITAVKVVTLGRVTETDTARAFTAAKAKTLGRVTETDTARTLTASGGAVSGLLGAAGGEPAATGAVAAHTTLSLGLAEGQPAPVGAVAAPVARSLLGGVE